MRNGSGVGTGASGSGALGGDHENGKSSDEGGDKSVTSATEALLLTAAALQVPSSHNSSTSGGKGPNDSLHSSSARRIYKYFLQPSPELKYQTTLLSLFKETSNAVQSAFGGAGDDGNNEGDIKIEKQEMEEGEECGPNQAAALLADTVPAPMSHQQNLATSHLQNRFAVLLGSDKDDPGVVKRVQQSAVRGMNLVPMGYDVSVSVEATNRLLKKEALKQQQRQQQKEKEKEKEREENIGVAEGDLDRDSTPSLVQDASLASLEEQNKENLLSSQGSQGSQGTARNASEGGEGSQITTPSPSSQGVWETAKGSQKSTSTVSSDGGGVLDIAMKGTEALFKPEGGYTSRTMDTNSEEKSDDNRLECSMSVLASTDGAPDGFFQPRSRHSFSTASKGNGKSDTDGATTTTTTTTTTGAGADHNGVPLASFPSPRLGQVYAGALLGLVNTNRSTRYRETILPGGDGSVTLVPSFSKSKKSRFK